MSITEAKFYGDAVGVDPMSSNITLTNLSLRVHRLDPDAAGRTITLPDAMLLDVGGPNFFILNVDATDTIAIKDDGGATIHTLAVLNIATICLANNTTSNGKWIIKAKLFNTAAPSFGNSADRTDTIENLEPPIKVGTIPDTWLSPQDIWVAGSQELNSEGNGLFLVDTTNNVRLRTGSNGGLDHPFSSENYIYASHLPNVDENPINTHYGVAKISKQTGKFVWKWSHPEDTGQVNARGIAVNRNRVCVVHANTGIIKRLYLIGKNSGRTRFAHDNADPIGGNTGVVFPSGSSSFLVSYKDFETYGLGIVDKNGSPGAIGPPAGNEIDGTLFQPTLTNPYVRAFAPDPDGTVVVVLTDGNTVGSNIEHWIARVSTNLQTLLDGPDSMGTIPKNITYGFAINPKTKEIWMYDNTSPGNNIYRRKGSDLSLLDSGALVNVGIEPPARIIPFKDRIIFSSEEIGGGSRLRSYDILLDEIFIVNDVVPFDITGLNQLYDITL